MYIKKDDTTLVVSENIEYNINELNQQFKIVEATITDKEEQLKDFTEKMNNDIVELEAEKGKLQNLIEQFNNL